MKKTNEIQLLPKYKEMSRELDDINKGRWLFTFHYGKLEVWDKISRESIYIMQDDLPKFREVIEYLEKK